MMYTIKMIVEGVAFAATLGLIVVIFIIIGA
jgi:hypothetical protein